MATHPSIDETHFLNFGAPDPKTELVEGGPHMWEIGSVVPNRIKTMTYKIDTCRFLAWHSKVISEDKDRLTQCQDTVTGWDGRSWFQRSSLPMGQHYKVTMSTHYHKLIHVLI